MIDYEIDEDKESSFSWLTNNLFIAQRDNITEIFCTRDGTNMVTINDSNIKIITSKFEFQRTVKALVDKASKRIYAPSLD
jgi:hypothetical protein